MGSQKKYTVQEMGMWVHLLLRRAEGRTDSEKRACDFREAQIYIDMMQGVLNQAIKNSKAPTELTAEPPSRPTTVIPGPGVVRDSEGRVIAISSQPGQRGYDKDISKIKGVEIWCDGIRIEKAHTADVEAGVVKYYERDERGRIKTIEAHGKVEIKGLL